MSIYKYQPIIDRMLEVGEYKNATALALDLGISPQALSNYKRRNTVPLNLIHRLAERYMISLNWLCYGEGKREREGNDGR